MAEVVQLFNDLTASTPAEEMKQNLQTMYDNNLTFDEQIEILCQLVRETQERTIFTTDEGNRVKEKLIDAMIDNCIRPMCEKIRQGMSNITSPISTNPDDYIWTFYTINGFGMFDGGYQNCYGYRGKIEALAKMKTTMPDFTYDTTHGIPRALATKTNSLVSVSTGEIYIRSDAVDPFSYKYFDHSNLSQTNTITKFFYNTGTQAPVVLFDQIIGWILTPAAFDIVRENPSGKADATSGKYPSTEMGGLGTFDDITDLMEETTLPNINISDLGFIGLWEPSKAELQQLAAIVWNDPWNLKEWPDIWKAALIKPLDNIISLAMFPFPATYRDENHNNILTVNNETFVFGGYICDGALPGTRKLTMNKVKQQIIDYSMGEISLKEYFGSFMDYAPYTTIQLYLPFYGFVDIDTNSVMNCDSLKVKYRINLLDGSAVIKIYVKKSADSAKQSGSVEEQFLLSEYNTNVKLDIALSSGDNAAILQRQVDYATFIANGLTGGAFLYGGIANAPKGTTTTKAFRLPPQNWRAEQRTMARAQSDNATYEDRMQATMDLFSPGMNAITYASSPDERKAAYKHYYGLEETEVNNSKDTNKGASNGRAGYEDVSRAIPSISIPSGGACRGNVGGGSSGFMGELRPYLIITRPIQVLPEQFGELNGYPLEVSVELGNLKGFVKVENIRLDNMDATDDEKHAITKQLMDGVFL